MWCWGSLYTSRRLKAKRAWKHLNVRQQTPSDRCPHFLLEEGKESVLQENQVDVFQVISFAGWNKKASNKDLLILVPHKKPHPAYQAIICSALFSCEIIAWIVMCEMNLRRQYFQPSIHPSDEKGKSGGKERMSCASKGGWLLSVLGLLHT